MKANKYMATLVASLAVAVAPSAMADLPPITANLLAGWYAFEGGSGIENADIINNTLIDSAFVTETTDSNIGANAGCTDSFYGSANISAPAGSPGLNGSATLTGASATVFSLINGPDPLNIGYLLFDIRRADAPPFGPSPGEPKITVSYSIVGGASGNIVTNFPSPIQSIASTNDYSDFDFNLQALGLVVPANGKIDFSFSVVGGSNIARLDNIAITLGSAIPEPGSMLALGCFLGSGLLIRRNRRSVA